MNNRIPFITFWLFGITQALHLKRQQQAQQYRGVQPRPLGLGRAFARAHGYANAGHMRRDLAQKQEVLRLRRDYEQRMANLGFSPFVAQQAAA